MPGPFDILPFFLAQAAAAAPAPAGDPGSQPSMLMQLIPFLPAIPLFYFLLLRPQQQAEKKRKALLGSIKKNDRVLTSGGIYGTVISVDTPNNRVVLRVDEDGRVKIPFSIASVVQVIEVSPVKPSPSADL